MPQYMKAVEEHVQGVLYYDIPENSDVKTALKNVVKIANNHNGGDISNERYPFSREIIFSHHGIELPVKAGYNPDLLYEKYEYSKYQQDIARKKLPPSEQHEPVKASKEEERRYGLHYKVPENAADKHIPDLIKDAFSMSITLSHDVTFEHHGIHMPMSDKLNEAYYLKQYDKLKAQQQQKAPLPNGIATELTVTSMATSKARG